MLADQHGRLRETARAEPDLTASEYRDRLGACCGVVTARRALRRLGLAVNKSDPRLRAIAP